MIGWLRRKLRAIGRRNLLFAALSIGITSVVVTGFLIENRYGYLPRDPLLIFVENWSEDRSAKDALAEQARAKAEAAMIEKATPEELQQLYEQQAAARAAQAEARAAAVLGGEAPE